MKKIYILTITIILIVITLIIYYPKKDFFPRAEDKPFFSEDVIDKKIESIEAQLETNSNNLELKVNLGIYYFLKGEKYYDKAINLLDSAWRAGVLDKRIFYYLGYMYDYLNLPNFAIIEYKKFLLNEPKDIETKLRLANLYYRKKEINEAINLYEDILSYDKYNIVALTNLGIIYYDQSNYVDAKEYLLNVKKFCNKKNIIEPKNINFYLGKIFFINKEFSSAKEYFEHEITLFPDNLPARIELIKTYIALKDKHNAMLHYKHILQVDPANKEVKKLLTFLR